MKIKLDPKPIVKNSFGLTIKFTRGGMDGEYPDMHDKEFFLLAGSDPEATIRGFADKFNALSDVIADHRHRYRDLPKDFHCIFIYNELIIPISIDLDIEYEDGEEVYEDIFLMDIYYYDSEGNRFLVDIYDED